MSYKLDHISVCICTYKRPKLLCQLLEKLNDIRTDNLFTYSIVVVDNDSAQSAKNVVAYFKKKSLINFSYYCEPEQNISLARNRAVKNAKGDFVAFIDDDEFPSTSWLISLLKAFYKYGADGIQGPVKPYFEKKPPRWIIKGKFYQRPSYPTGLVLTWRQGRTGNLLLRRNIFNESVNMFNPKFGSGAEDQDFFRRMITKDYVFKYCSEAIVYEHVPPVRWKRTFMLKRSLLRGKVTLNHPTSNVFDIIKSLIAIPLYTLTLPLLFFIAHHIFMKYLVKNFDHIGKILALCGVDIIKQKYVTK